MAEGDEDAAIGRQDAVLTPLVVGSRELERWFREYSPRIYNYAARRLGPSVAEDITSATFIEAWACRDRFDPDKGTARAWLFGIATNLISRHARSERRQLRAYARTGADPVAVDGFEGVVDRLAAAAGEPAIARALSKLRQVDRDLFWLSVTTELTYEELAVVTGVAVGTVRSRLSRTRAQLRAAISPGAGSLNGSSEEVSQ